MSDMIIYLGSFATAAFILMALYFTLRSREPALARLKANEVGFSSETSIRKNNPESKILKALKPFQDRIEKDDDISKGKRQSLLTSAGYYSPATQTIFYAARIILAVIFSSAMATIFVLKGTFEPLTLTIVVTLAAIIGYYLPLIYILIKISERKTQFNHGFPDAMDMILICLESGLSFPAALKHVSKELFEVHPVVSEQFEIATLEFQAGRKRSEALRNLANRVDLPEVTSVTTMIIQSDALGTSLTRALRAAAEDMRRDRMLKAEAKANALPAKMSVPLVLCIFPTLFAVIMVPVVVRIVRLIPG